MGVYSGTAIFAQPVIGAWVDRAGRRPFMLGGAALAGVAALLFALFPGALLLFPLLRALQGLAYSMFFIANFTVIVDMVPPERRGQALGIFGISGLISTAVGPAVGEIIVRAYGFRVFFAVMAAVSFAALLVAARLDPPPAPHPARGGGLADLVQGVLTAPRVTMALAFAFGLGLGVVFTFLPIHAAALGVERIGLFAVAYSAGALTVRAIGGQLIDRLGRRPVIIPALGAQAVGTLLLAAMGPLASHGAVRPAVMLVVVGLLAGAAHGFLYPALSALVMDVTPEHRRGRMIGVQGAFTLGGQALGAMAFGYLAHAVGYPATFAVLAVCLAAATWLARELER